MPMRDLSNMFGTRNPLAYQACSSRSDCGRASPTARSRWPFAAGAAAGTAGRPAPDAGGDRRDHTIDAVDPAAISDAMRAGRGPPTPTRSARSSPGARDALRIAFHFAGADRGSSCAGDRLPDSAWAERGGLAHRPGHHARAVDVATLRLIGDRPESRPRPRGRDGAGGCPSRPTSAGSGAGPDRACGRATACHPGRRAVGVPQPKSDALAVRQVDQRRGDRTPGRRPRRNRHAGVQGEPADSSDAGTASRSKSANGTRR
jgi:hypothetical protein